MITTAPATRPVPPTQPDTLRWLITDHNKVMSTINKAIRYGHQLPGGLGEDIVPGLWDDVRTYQELITEWHATDEGRTYAAAVERYNAQAKAWNEAIKARRQARRNTAEVTKVRQGACPTCFATHAGEC